MAQSKQSVVRTALPVPPRIGRRRVADSLVAQMHADYSRPMSLKAVGRKYNRTARCIRMMFRVRGLSVRPFKIIQRQANGSPVRYVPLTKFQIDRLINKATSLRIPDELRFEWRSWPLARRCKFIAALRARLNVATDAPKLAYSPNVVPFVYGDEHAHALAKRHNGGQSSRLFKQRLKIASQGVIYRDQLWFWASGTGYCAGVWRRETGRPVLHHVIWEEAHGRKVPPGFVVRHADGNKNNLLPANLVLASRNDLARENQGVGLAKASRSFTAMLLKKSQRGDTGHLTSFRSLFRRRGRQKEA